MKIIYIDVETTGIECPNSGLIQLAGAIELDGEVVEHFNFHMRPFPEEVVCEDALAVNGLSREDIEGFEEPRAVFCAFLALLSKYIDRYDKADKFHLVGYNAKFDADHLRAWFNKNNDRYFGSWFWHPPLDVMGMAALALTENRHTIANFKLPTVASALGLEVDESRMHDAFYDISLTRDLFRHLFKRVRSGS